MNDFVATYSSTNHPRLTLTLKMNTLFSPHTPGVGQRSPVDRRGDSDHENSVSRMRTYTRLVGLIFLFVSPVHSVNRSGSLIRAYNMLAIPRTDAGHTDAINKQTFHALGYVKHNRTQETVARQRNTLQPQTNT